MIFEQGQTLVPSATTYTPRWRGYSKTPSHTAEKAKGGPREETETQRLTNGRDGTKRGRRESEQTLAQNDPRP